MPHQGLGKGSPDTSRQLSIKDLETLLPSMPINEVIHKLVNANLLVTDKPKDKQVVVVNIVHETLIQHWELLRGWLDNNRKAIIIQRNIEADAKRWDKNRYKKALLRGRNLDDAKDYYKTHTEKIPLSELAQDFVQRSIKWQRFIWIGVFVFIVGLIGTGLYAYEQQKQAEYSTHQTLVNDANSLGNRGEWTKAFDKYTKAIEDNFYDKIELEIKRLRAFFALGNRSDLKQALDKFQARNDLGDYEATVLLLRGDFIMSESGKEQEGLALVQKALETGNLSKLNHANTPYAEGLLAKNFNISISKFREALDIDPFHHRANIALLTMLLFSGEFDEARQRIDFIQVIFPDDPLSFLVEPWIELLEGNNEIAFEKLTSLSKQNSEHKKFLDESEMKDMLAYLQLIGDLLDILKQMNTLGAELSFIETMSFIGKVGQLGINTQMPVLEKFGLNLPTVRLLFESMEEFFKAYSEDIFGQTESAVHRFTKISKVHPDAIFIQKRAQLEMKLASRKYQRGDKTWLDDWKLTVQLFRQASQASSIVPWFKRSSRIFAMWTEALLLKAQPEPRDLKRIAQLRQDIYWLLDKGQLRTTERKKLIPELVNLLEPELGRSLLIDWQEKEPKNLVPVKMMAQLEFSAGNYATALKIANRVLIQQPNNQEMQKIKKTAIEEMQKILESISPAR